MLLKKFAFIFADKFLAFHVSLCVYVTLLKHFGNICATQKVKEGLFEQFEII